MRISKKYQLKHKVLALICIAVVSSCVDPITLETNSSSGELVFFGNFTQLHDTHIFYVSKTSEFGKPVVPVSNAQIIIMDDQGNSAEYTEMEPGQYELDTNQIQGVPGRSYQVEIALEDGRAFCSSPQVMPEPIEIQQLYFETAQIQTLSSSGNLVEQTVLEIYIDTPLQNSSGISTGFRWTVDEVYSFTDLKCHDFFDVATTCYFQVPVEEPEVLIYKNEGSQENLERFKVHSRLLAPDDEFVERHYFTVHQYSLDDETYRYWQQVKVVTSQTGSLFDSPPAMVMGNMYEQDRQNSPALGIFEVSGQSVKRTYTLPHLIEGHKVIETCPIRRTGIVQDKCCFCWLLDEDENRIERPDYWDED